MKPNPESDTAIVRYLDGTLDGEELRRFGERLAEDAELRAELREVAEQAVAMGDLGRGRNLVALPSEVSRAETSPPRSWWGPAGWLAAAASLMLGLGAVFWPDHEATPAVIATLDFADGAVHWSGGIEDAKSELAPGDELASGNLVVESASGAAQMTFRDGTRLTVTGESEISIAETDRKHLTLRRGNLTADVAEQPAGRPLTIQTPSAEIEVLGTVLSVSSNGESTTLSVDEGLVRLRRLADGSMIEVPAGHLVTATIDSSQALTLESTDALPEAWALDFEDGAARVTKGERVSVAGVPCYQGVPYIAARGEDNTRVIRRGVAINGPSDSEASFVQLTPDSRLRLRYRSDWGPVVFLSTQEPDGSFGGNFEYRVRLDDSEPDGGGWRTVSIAIEDFELLKPLRHGSRRYTLSENKLSKILVSSVEHKRLQVADVAVEVISPESE